MIYLNKNALTCTDESSFPQNSTWCQNSGVGGRHLFSGLMQRHLLVEYNITQKSAGVRQDSDVLNNRKLDNCLILFISYVYVIYIVQIKCMLSLIAASFLFFDVFVTGSYFSVVVLEYAHVCFLIYLQLQ